MSVYVKSSKTSCNFFGDLKFLPREINDKVTDPHKLSVIVSLALKKHKKPGSLIV